MKKLLVLLLAVAFVGAAQLSAQSLSKTDRDQLLKHLARTRKGLEAATKGLTPAQWNFKPAPDRWSIAECYEHIAAAEDLLRDMVENQVLKTPSQPERVDAAKQQAGDATLNKVVTDRSQKFKAPDPLQPTNRYGSYQGSQKHFAESRKRTIAFVKNTKDDLRSHFMQGPPGDSDGVQWLLLLSGHSERHTLQIQEVKADPNFPKK